MGNEVYAQGIAGLEWQYTIGRKMKIWGSEINLIIKQDRGTILTSPPLTLNLSKDPGTPTPNQPPRLFAVATEPVPQNISTRIGSKAFTITPSEGEVVTILMSPNDKVTAEMIKAIKGENITLLLEFSVHSWEIDGKTVMNEIIDTDYNISVKEIYMGDLSNAS